MTMDKDTVIDPDDGDRDKFHEFINEMGLGGSLNVHSALTQATDPQLRFRRIEKFIFSVITMAEMETIIDYCKINDLGLYLAFNHLCIGYPEGKPQMRLGAF